jgi:hypothetical protein
MYRIIAAVAALLMPSMASAGTTWNTACDTGHGGIRGWNFGSATPRGGQCREDRGQTITSFRVEVPGTQFGKRRRTLTDFGEVTLITFPIGSQNPIFEIYLVYEWLTDEDGGALGEAECALYVDYHGNPPEQEDSAAPGHLPATFSLAGVGATPHARASVGRPAAWITELRQYIDTIEGHTLRTEDVFVQEVSFGECYGAGIFRYADDPRKFYER